MAGKYLFCLLLLLFARPAFAQEALPDGVIALCGAQYPDYAIRAHDGWGNEAQGQYALVLSKDGDNILCIAEKAQGDCAYAFTVENTHAVREGEDIPSLLIDTGGDSLFYSYLDQDLYKIGYHSLKQGGVWGIVSLDYTDASNPDYDLDTWISISNGELHYDGAAYDKLENPVSKPEVRARMPIPVSDAYIRSLYLDVFDVEMLSPNPAFLRVEEGLCDALLESGDTLLQVQINAEDVIMLVKKPDGTKRLRICTGWDDARNDYAVEESRPLPDEASLDLYHAGEGTILLGLCGESLVCSFKRGAQGRYFANTMQGRETFGLGYDCADDLSLSNWCRNDGAVYGNAPWSGDILTLDLTAMPETFEEAAAMLKTDSYALVLNPNPQDRLHLRESPHRSAASLGKFYNRTPVEVLSRADGWAHVRIGRGLYSFTGYMMDKYLAFGEDQSAVSCAFPQLTPVGDDGAVVDVHLGANKHSKVVAQVSSGGYYIVGVYGDDWLIIMTRSGVIGYALRSDFWEGNG